MCNFCKSQIERHIKTHHERAVIDSSAVATLNFYFKGGRINTDFACRDTWPNIDGHFELVPTPEHARHPVQNFMVQIKGTNDEAVEKDGYIKYHLDSLGFPAYVYCNVTLDPSILFVVYNANETGRERIFWKYMSVEFLRSIDFGKESITIKFTSEDEIKIAQNKLDVKSLDNFVKKLTALAERHSFVKALDSTQFTKEDVVRIIQSCSNHICKAIDQIDVLNETRDNVSQLMLTRLEDLCSSALLLHAISLGYEMPDIRLAWELSLLDINTKFLCGFLQSLRYLGRRIPEDGQTERLMLKYYDFLWQLRSYLKENHGLAVLENLEKFPYDEDEEDKEYISLIADSVDKVSFMSDALRPLRYYVERKTPFYVNGKRYFEITLQLAGKYASKFNRFTVYTKFDISTNYSIQIGYIESDIELWNKPAKIKVITNWKVSIDPAVLNKFSNIFSLDIKLTSRFGEYISLMEFLTRTGINFLDLIDMSQKRFEYVLNKIYKDVNTSHFKALLELLRTRFAEKSRERGRNTIRYLLLRLREENIENILAKESDKKLPYANVNIKSNCTPYELNPILYNLPKSNTNGKTLSKDVLRATGAKRMGNMLPYTRLKFITETTGEIYINSDDAKLDEDEIAQYNNNLSEWDFKQGKSIKCNQGLIWIDEYERTTLSVLRKLLEYSKSGNDGQKQLNRNYLRAMGSFEDEAKKKALEQAFVDSRIMLIYGAAGTGKTTLIDYISDLMKGRSKLFITKTHTALENLQQRITSPGQASKFDNIDHFIEKKKKADYDIIFVDECSTIDNRCMLEFINLLDPRSLIVLAGDIYQIESIEFGNWFYYIKNIINSKAVVELTNTWRTEKENLKSLWETVRNRGELITEKLVIDGPFSENIGENLFRRTVEDEIVLCLNYDGRFGLNNINNYFQNANQNSEAFVWHEWKYKIGDPILFNQCDRFPQLHNNLKGKIVDINLDEDSITFTVDVKIILTDIDIKSDEIEIIDYTDSSTIIRFTVYANKAGAIEEEREEASLKTIIPFQLAYAVSIHKSQGLEYESVKVVIPKSNSEKISHGIFYTAITRAKKQLKIYWSSETMTKTIQGFSTVDESSASLNIIKSKLLDN